MRQDRSVRRQRRSKNVEKIRRQKVFENETDSGKSFACDSNVICWLRAGSVPGADTEAQMTSTPAAIAQAERIDTGFVVTNPDSYDSADTAVLVDINNVDNTVTLLNLDLGKRYTLSMDGTTRFADKYGKAISLSQLQEGDIVDVTF